jgi:hypothetical protein
MILVSDRLNVTVGKDEIREIDLVIEIRHGHVVRLRSSSTLRISHSTCSSLLMITMNSTRQSRT